jgi:hypothetical protein
MYRADRTVSGSAVACHLPFILTADTDDRRSCGARRPESIRLHPHRESRYADPVGVIRRKRVDTRTASSVMIVTLLLGAVIVLRVWAQRLRPSPPGRLAISQHEGMRAWSLRLHAARPPRRTLPQPRGVRTWILQLHSSSQPDHLTVSQHEDLIALLDAFDDDEEIALEFWQIENAIGGLPKDAKHSVSWWTGEGNAKPAWHPPGVWQDAGYIAYPPNLRRRFVTFRRWNHPRQRQEILPYAPISSDLETGTMMPTEPPVTRYQTRRSNEHPLAIAVKSWYARRPFGDTAESRSVGNGPVTKRHTDATAF